jgi:hypothetical protein
MGSFEEGSIIEAAKIAIKLIETAEIAEGISLTVPMCIRQTLAYLSNVRLPVKGLHSFVNAMI